MIKELSILGLSLLAQTPAPPSDIVYGVNMDYAMPLVEVVRSGEKPKLVGGLLKDIGDALFQELKVPPEILLLPKRRVAPGLASGSVSVLCHLSEVWQPLIKDDVWWSEPLYKSTNLIVYTKSKPIRKVSDLYGERIGTVLNFIYQNLDEQFMKQTMVREDGPNNESNIKKLIRGRLQYAIMSNLEYEYYHKKYPELQFADLQMDVVMTKCALSKNSNLSLEELNRAIKKIKEDGTLEKILKKYR
ncbi:Arginine-binding extracellular protein ArtP precursor [compost metagenome]